VITIAEFFTTIGMDQQPTEYFFGIYHLIYFLGFVIAFVLLFYFLSKANKKVQKRFITIALIIILFLKYIVEAIFIYEYYNVPEPYSNYPHPFWDVNTFFSFQLCGVMNILLPIVIWFNIKKLKFFVYLTSILGGLSVIFYPVTVLYGEPFIFTLPMVRSIVVHFFLVFIPLFLINQGEIKIKSRLWPELAIGIISVAIWAMFGNLVIDKSANNMYLMRNPFYQGPIPIINSLGNGWHVLFLAVAVTIGYMMVYHLAKLFSRTIVIPT